MAKMKWHDWLAIVLIIVGALNWGLVGFGFNLVEFIFGEGTLLTKIVYWIVGAAGIFSIFSLYKSQKK